jgi:ferredoxin
VLDSCLPVVHSHTVFWFFCFSDGLMKFFITVIVQKGLCMSCGYCEGKCTKNVLIVGDINNSFMEVM